MKELNNLDYVNAASFYKSQKAGLISNKLDTYEIGALAGAMSDIAVSIKKYQNKEINFQQLSEEIKNTLSNFIITIIKKSINIVLNIGINFILPKIPALAPIVIAVKDFVLNKIMKPVGEFVKKGINWLWEKAKKIYS